MFSSKNPVPDACKGSGGLKFTSTFDIALANPFSFFGISVNKLMFGLRFPKNAQRHPSKPTSSLALDISIPAQCGDLTNTIGHFKREDVTLFDPKQGAELAAVVPKCHTYRTIAKVVHCRVQSQCGLLFDNARLIRHRNKSKPTAPCLSLLHLRQNSP